MFPLVPVHPDEPFPNLRASNSVDRQVLCSSKTVVWRISKLQNCERAPRNSWILPLCDKEQLVYRGFTHSLP